MSQPFILLVFFLKSFSCVIALERIDIVSYSPYIIPTPNEHISYETYFKYNLIKEKFEVNFNCDPQKYVDRFSCDNPGIKKIIFFEYCNHPKIGKMPKSKMICFRWEAIKIKPELYDFYYRVYTFDDDLVDNKKFFKFYYPVLQPMIDGIPSFEEKNLCVMIAGNWIPERISILDFFVAQPRNTLHVYGFPPMRFRYTKMYKGQISGFYSGPDKLNVLKNYKFCICFENTHTTPGYITEKIFDVFAAGCVPIYWGPDNVEDYIPPECYIDYRQFKNMQEMYDFITRVTESEYEHYIDHIREFLKSEKVQLFSMENFENILYQAAMD